MEGFGRVNGSVIDVADTKGLAWVPLLPQVPDRFCVISPGEAS